jgi:hypothetical protein
VIWKRKIIRYGKLFMMFKPGNIMRHKSSDSMWIIIDVKDLGEQEKKGIMYDYWGKTSQIDAHCLYTGPKADWWKAGENDIWFVDNDRNEETNYFSSQWEVVIEKTFEDIKN